VQVGPGCGSDHCGDSALDEGSVDEDDIGAGVVVQDGTGGQNGTAEVGKNQDPRRPGRRP
jgi:hypothetical protein